MLKLKTVSTSVLAGLLFVSLFSPSAEAKVVGHIVEGNEDNGIQVVGEGLVTFAVVFDNENEVTYTTKVVADEAIHSIKENGETKRFTINVTSTDFTVFDQFGFPFSGNDEQVTI